jgi:uncharacterized protein YciI
MTKTIAMFMRHGSQWDSHKPVREQAYWDDHARFMDALFDAGRVILAGPFADDSGTMIILAADSVEEALATMRDDPWAKRDILVAADAKEWTIFLDSRSHPR